MIQAWKFISNNMDLLVLAAILIVVFILFIRDFDLKNKRSWMILLGLSALGAIVFYRAIKKNQLLKELEKREKELEKLEEEYNNLEKKAQISHENLEKAREKLREAKKKTALDILRIDEKYHQDVQEIEKEIEETKPEDMILRVREIINN
jgi:cell division protein FtsL